MARRKKAENAKTSEETPSTAPELRNEELRDEGEVKGMEANVEDVAENPESVTVNENEGGEATHGTSKEGDESPVENTDKIPQNDVTEIERAQDVTEAEADEIGEKADLDRTEEELQYADESNPNQKGRNAAAPGKYDQDGNLRTDGYSYGVAADDTRGMDEDATKLNEGEEPEKENPKEKFTNKRVFVAERTQTDTTNQEDPNVELSAEEVEKLEEELSRPKDGVSARVVSSTASYYRIKFFRNNKPFVTYKARTNKLDKAEVKKFVTEALKVEQ